jgi:diacylglycerol kinase family enzyme
VSRVAGGDGSQARDIARRHGTAFVCVPAGTRNHFALGLRLDRDDVPAALGDAVERWVDLAKINGRAHVNNASLGLRAVTTPHAPTSPNESIVAWLSAPVARLGSGTLSNSARRHSPC